MIFHMFSPLVHISSSHNNGFTATPPVSNLLAAPEAPLRKAQGAVKLPGTHTQQVKAWQQADGSSLDIELDIWLDIKNC